MDRYQEPEFLPWDGRRVPMTFIAGYLGAGKTTLINAFLARVDRPVAVLVNDVGEINIDARLIRQRSGDTIELTDGCVCCSISQGFGQALDQLRSRETPPDHVVVELSGVSIPNRVLPWAKSAGFILDGVITVVDVDQLGDRMQNETSAGTIEAQLRDADVVILTKSELAGPKRTDGAVASVNHIAPNATVRFDSVDNVVALLQLGGRRPEGPDATPQASLFDTHHVSRTSLPTASPGALLSLVEDLPETVVRAKGVGIDTDGNLWLLQRVGSRSTVVELSASERQAPTDLVIISLPA